MKFKTNTSYNYLFAGLALLMIIVFHVVEPNYLVSFILAILMALSLLPLRNSYLQLNETGITESTFFKNWEYKWDEVKDFEIIEYDETMTIGFMIVDNKSKKLLKSAKDCYLKNIYSDNLETILESIEKHKQKHCITNGST